jgi:NADH-quinone oxidoreductase subunit A
MTTGYVPIVILAGLAGAFAVLSVIVSAVLGPHRPTPAKTFPYESGIDPIRLPRNQLYPVKFYVVAMLFIIFDIETIFLFPWAVAFRGLGLFGLVEMIVFIGLVFVAYLYVWQKGGLEWEGPERRAGAGAVPSTVGRLPASYEEGPGEYRRPVGTGSR